MNNWRETILSQYANSPTICGLVESFNDCIDPSKDIDTFFDVIWNVETANDAGLEFWGKVVDIGRQLQVTPQLEYFGFEGAYNPGDPSNPIRPFDQGVFYDGPPETNTYTLTTEAYRKLILVKAMSNITDVTAESMNRMLMYIWGENGRAFVQDAGNMEMRFVFEFALSPVDISIITRSNAIARPAGVLLSLIIQFNRETTFGFDGSGLQPFDQGVFLPEGSIINASQ